MLVITKGWRPESAHRSLVYGPGTLDVEPVGIESVSAGKCPHILDGSYVIHCKMTSTFFVFKQLHSVGERYICLQEGCPPPQSFWQMRPEMDWKGANSEVQKARWHGCWGKRPAME